MTCGGVIVLGAVLTLGGCATTSAVYSLKIERVHHAYLDRSDNLLVCMIGELDGSTDRDSPKTIIVPLSTTGLERLEKKFIYNPVGATNYFQDAEVRGYGLNRTWLRAGCLSDDEKKQLNPIPVVADLVPKEHLEIDPAAKSRVEIRQARVSATAWYLEQMRPGDASGKLYLLRGTDGRMLPSFVYVAEAPRFNGVDKAGFSLVWTENQLAPVNPLALAGAVVIAAPWTIGHSIGEKQAKRDKERPLTEQDKQEIALTAAEERGCSGEISRLPEEPRKWDDPGERAYLVRCAKDHNEVKVRCRYFSSEKRECFVKSVKSE